MGPVFGSVGLAADIFLLVLPLPIIFRLNLATGRKIALAAVFMMGTLWDWFWLPFATPTDHEKRCHRQYRRTELQDANLRLRWSNMERGEHICWSVRTAARNYDYQELMWLLGSIVESYITIIVSCAPAISSIWINKISQSSSFTSFRNLITRSRTTHITRISDRVVSSSKNLSTDSAINLDTRTQMSEEEQILYTNQSKSHIEIRSVPQQFNTAKGGIHKSMWIDQSTTMRESR